MVEGFQGWDCWSGKGDADDIGRKGSEDQGGQNRIEGGGRKGRDVWISKGSALCR